MKLSLIFSAVFLSSNFVFAVQYQTITKVYPVIANENIQNNQVQNLKFNIVNENLNEISKAINFLKSQNPKNSEILRLQTIFYLDSSMFDNAEKTALKYLKVASSSYDAYVLLGNVFITEAQNSVFDLNKKIYLKKAFICFNKVFQENPNRPEAVVGLSRVYFEREDYGKSLDYFLDAKESDRDNPETLYYGAEFYMKRDDYEKAVYYFKLADYYSTVPNYKIHYNLGILYEKLADIKKAREEYNKAIEIKPDNKEILEKLNSLDE